MVSTARARQKTKTVSVSAPLGGWNARDALGAMKPEDAVTMTNWFPGTNSVILRNGYTKHATGLPGQVETLMVYDSASASKMFAASVTAIYDVTSSGAVGAASVSSLTNARFQYVNFTTSGGSYLLCVNGADKMRVFDGSAWHKDGDGAPYDVTGVNTAACSNIQLFKNYIWLIENASLRAWYLPIQAIGGAATSLDMRSVFQNGGYIMAAMTWTLDAGYGMDDMLAFITSTGEVAVWRLTDPTTPSGISLIGLYMLGSPIGRRCYMKYGGDLIIITQDGVVPMSSALQSSRLDPRVSITNKIQWAMSAAISSYGSNFGWQLLYFPKENQLYLNVPVREGSTQQQYVQNTITQSWCNFNGWEANCWDILSEEPYFGGNGFVGHAWNGTVDYINNIEAYCLQSFQSYGGPATKQCRFNRYHLLSSGSVNAFGGVNVDYDLADNTAALSTIVSNYGTWDSGLWDANIWGGDVAPLADWQSVSGLGYTFASALKTATQGISLQWVATDLVLEAGGVL